jgi:hypothetical protein
MRQIEEKDWNALKERIKAMLHDEQTSHVRSGRRMSCMSLPYSPSYVVFLVHE